MGDNLVQLRTLSGGEIDFALPNGRRIVINGVGCRPRIDLETAKFIVDRLRNRVAYVEGDGPNKAEPVMQVAKVEPVTPVSIPAAAVASAPLESTAPVGDGGAETFLAGITSEGTNPAAEKPAETPPVVASGANTAPAAEKPAAGTKPSGRK